MRLCTEETTRKQLARSRQLLFPPARSSFGGLQQDAVGEKWLGGPAASLRQDHRTGQGQVGSGLCCRWGHSDLKPMYGLSYSTASRLRWGYYRCWARLFCFVYWKMFRNFGDTLWFKSISFSVLEFVNHYSLLHAVEKHFLSLSAVQGKLLHSLWPKRLAMAFSHRD